MRWHSVIRNPRESEMHSHRFAAFAVLVFASSIFLEAREMPSQEGKTKYPLMAPVEEYLMADRNTEIALARSAAPRVHLARSDGSGSGTARLRNGRPRQERVCMCRGAGMDVPSRCSGVLEPENSGSDLLQSSRRTVGFAEYLQEDRDGSGGENED